MSQTFQNMTPDPKTSCGPYRPNPRTTIRRNIPSKQNIDVNNHDTIGIIAIDSQGNVAAGASTNGLTYKIPG